jgi:hypothetical protein
MDWPLSINEHKADVNGQAPTVGREEQNHGGGMREASVDQKR